MDNNRDWLKSEDACRKIISRYEDMIRKNTRYFFDVDEFEHIIDFYIESNRHSSALRAIDIASGQHPASVEIQLKKAHVLMNTGKKTEALNLLKKMERIEGANLDVYMLKGIIYIMLDQEKDAVRNFEHALSLAYNEKTDLLFSISISLENAGKFKLALRYLEQALEADVNNEVILYEMAYCYERMGNYEKSISYFQKYLDEDPYSENVWYNLGVIYNILEQYDKAIEAFDFAIAIDGKFSSAYFNKANSLANKGEYEKAIEVYHEFIPIDNDNIIAYYYIGECYEKLEKFDTSLEYYQKTLSLDESFSDAWLGIGYVEFQRENYMKSIQCAKRALEIENDNPEYWLLMANTYARLNNTKKAKEAYAKAVEFGPGDEEILVCYSDFEFSLNNLVEARDILNVSYPEVVESPLVNFRLAAYSLLLEDRPSAFSYLEKACDQDAELAEDFFKVAPDAKNDKEIVELIEKFKKTPLC
ncbi:MAG: tetratricopeptide repeat protein [Bacteroidia bacterium]|nr:tetratricopeptide repeat protein [Bacteroidia bacterium]